MEIGSTIDERIADGFYFCVTQKLVEYLFENPEELNGKVSTKVHVK